MSGNVFAQKIAIWCGDIDFMNYIFSTILDTTDEKYIVQIVDQRSLKKITYSDGSTVTLIVNQIVHMSRGVKYTISYVHDSLPRNFVDEFIKSYTFGPVYQVHEFEDFKFYRRKLL